MNNVMSLKALIKNIAKEKNISPQLVLQNYMLERFLERISSSKYNNNFIIKGGFLISYILGLSLRTTMDMDATIQNYPLNKENTDKMIKEIISINLNDKITFFCKRIDTIRENDEYGGYRIFLLGNYETLNVPFSLDLTTGDKITPTEIKFEYKTMFNNRSIFILAYNLETILAEKIESIISRGEENTRLRDFYDVFILMKLQGNNIKKDVLNNAVINTFTKRGSKQIITNYKKIIEGIKNSEIMIKLWKKYQQKYLYAKEINFLEICNLIVEIMDFQDTYQYN